MKKYWVVIKNTWNEILTYRFNFFIWRLRVLMSIISLYFFWLAIIPSNQTLFNYSQTLMITYILGASLIGSIVLSSRTVGVGENINRGDLSIFLIRPINYFLYWFSNDLGDKAMNILFSIFELTILFFILKPPIFLQTNIEYILLTILTIIIAVMLYFFFNLLLGFIGFWSPEVWAPRFIFFILLNFFAGMLFPLDILPKAIFSIFQLLPFPYLLYFPLKIYLGQLSNIEIYNGIFISLVWTFLLYVIVKMVWIKGLKTYTAQGR